MFYDSLILFVSVFSIHFVLSFFCQCVFHFFLPLCQWVFHSFLPLCQWVFYFIFSFSFLYPSLLVGLPLTPSAFLFAKSTSQWLYACFLSYKKKKRPRSRPRPKLFPTFQGLVTNEVKNPRRDIS